MMKKDSFNKILGIVLRIADIVDRHGEKGEECYILDELGYGYLSLSGYLRDGVKSAIDIQDKYSSLKNRLNYTEESEKDARNLFQTAYSDGYTDGFDKAKEEYAQHLRGTAHCTRATTEEVGRYGIELHGWCDCGKPIEGRWVGMANFCPWCGRVIEWEKDKTE